MGEEGDEMEIKGGKRRCEDVKEGEERWGVKESGEVRRGGASRSEFSPLASQERCLISLESLH